MQSGRYYPSLTTNSFRTPLGYRRALGPASTLNQGQQSAPAAQSLGSTRRKRLRTPRAIRDRGDSFVPKAGVPEIGQVKVHLMASRPQIHLRMTNPLLDSRPKADCSAKQPVGEPRLPNSTQDVTHTKPTPCDEGDPTAIAVGISFTGRL